MDPMFQAFSSPSVVPLESKLQTYLNVNSFQPSGIDETNFFLDAGNSSTNDTSSVPPLLSDVPRKASIPDASPFMSSVLPSSRMTHSLSSPSFSQYSLTPHQSLVNTAFGHLSIVGDSNNSCLGSQGTNSGCSPQQSPLLSKRSHSPTSTKLSFLSSHGASTPSPSHDPYVPSTTLIQESVGGTTYFYPSQDENNSVEALPIIMPDVHVFPGNPSHIEHMRPKDNAPSFFMPDELRLDILHRQQLTIAEVNSELYPDLPSQIDNYHKLCPLESISVDNQQKSSLFGCISTVYKAVNMKTGVHYCLRRMHGFRLSNTKCMNVVDAWKKIQHSNLVNLREVFTTKEFGDNSLVFVYDYHAGADTLMNVHFNHTQTTLNGYLPSFTAAGDGFHQSSKAGLNNLRQHAGLLPESLIWGYIVQLSSVLRTIHAAGLACRVFDPSKVLITGKSRLRLNCCGIHDVLTYDVNQTNSKQVAAHYQQEDLVAFGRIVLALACNSLSSVQRQNVQSSLELIARSYSPDLRNLILYLLTSNSRPRSINDIMPMIGARFYTQLDAAQMRSDVIENELAKEVENGRLFRLIAKLGIIVERPEFNMDPSWSETGDRYLLKLFRDYLFHQVTEDGRPWIDASHIVLCLNKLDAGVTEKVCLMSRDEQNVLVVSYAELKACFEASYAELSNAPPPKIPGVS